MAMSKVCGICGSSDLRWASAVNVIPAAKPPYLLRQVATRVNLDCGSCLGTVERHDADEFLKRVPV
jgi:hypothetical protein